MRLTLLLVLFLPFGAIAQPETDASQASAALTAYRATVNAFNERRPDAYFSGYAERLECFYKVANYPAKSFRKDRRSQFKSGGQHLEIAELTVVSASADEVVLIDRGTWKSPKGKAYQHEKVVKLRAVAGKWTIVVEASKKTNKCFKNVFGGGKAAGKPLCAPNLKRCFQRCDADRSASPNKEMLCLQQCEEAYEGCAGGPVPAALIRLGI